MIELPLIFLGGLLGSAHCVGMCGGFALLIGAPAPRWSSNLVRQLVYSGGRIFTYCSFGAAVGYGGLRLAERLGNFVNVQATIAIAAGILLVVQGLISTGTLRHVSHALRRLMSGASSDGHSMASSGGVGCLMGGMVGAFLRDRRWSHVFLAGVFTGLLPCGLVYAYVALAASTSDLLSGAATMAAFGLGTMPLMLLTGTGSTLFSFAGRRRLLTIAAWCVLLTGMLSIVRGVGFMQAAPGPPAASCPFCD
jgi:sulfite exporter TauE/SafE